MLLPDGITSIARDGETLEPVDVSSAVVSESVEKAGLPVHMKLSDYITQEELLAKIRTFKATPDNSASTNSMLARERYNLGFRMYILGTTLQRFSAVPHELASTLSPNFKENPLMFNADQLMNESDTDRLYGGLAGLKYIRRATFVWNEAAWFIDLKHRIQNFKDNNKNSPILYASYFEDACYLFPDRLEELGFDNDFGERLEDHITRCREQNVTNTEGFLDSLLLYRLAYPVGYKNYALTQAEFDVFIESHVKPFRYAMSSDCINLIYKLAVLSADRIIIKDDKTIALSKFSDQPDEEVTTVVPRPVGRRI